MKWYMLIPPLWAVAMVVCIVAIARRDARPPKPKNRGVEVLGTFHRADQP